MNNDSKKVGAYFILEIYQQFLEQYHMNDLTTNS